MDFTALRDALGADNLLTDSQSCWAYGYDNSKRHGDVAAVAFAQTHEQVQTIARFCNETLTPIVARGRGTGTTGAAVPIKPSLVLSFERMNQTPVLNKADRYVSCEPGVTNQELQNVLKPAGFFWPPDPSSAAFCTVGGNLAFNSAGPRAVKYGTPRENTLGLKCVLANGETLKTGSYTTKSVVGLDLTRLIIGSEGTLAFITEATLKLTPLQRARKTFQVYYKSMSAAADAVSAIMAQPVIPCALEFIDKAAINAIRKFSEFSLPEDVDAMLMIEIDGDANSLEHAAISIKDAAAIPGMAQLHEAKNAAEAASLWATRKALSPALRNIAPKKINEDVVVPVSKVAELIDSLQIISEQHGIPIVNFGHAGNGNIHVNLLYHPDNEAQATQAQPCLNAVFDKVISLGGSLSGEHGVGIDKRDHVHKELGETSIELMRGIKKVFDPNNILNPNKGFPE